MFRHWIARPTAKNGFAPRELHLPAKLHTSRWAAFTPARVRSEISDRSSSAERRSFATSRRPVGVAVSIASVSEWNLRHGRGDHRASLSGRAGYGQPVELPYNQRGRRVPVSSGSGAGQDASSSLPISLVLEKRFGTRLSSARRVARQGLAQLPFQDVASVCHYPRPTQHLRSDLF